MTTPEKDIVVFIDVLDRRTEYPLSQFENRKVSATILRLAPVDEYRKLTPSDIRGHFRNNLQRKAWRVLCS